MSDPDDNFMEKALIALTWIELTQNPDRESAEADQQLMLQTYGKEEINKGALLTLAVMLALNAYVSGESLTDRIQTERDLIRENLDQNFDHEKINIALTYVSLDQNPDREKAKADKELVLLAYPREYIYEGALLTLTVMLLAQANNLQVSLGENTQRVRRIMRDSMRFETSD